MEKNNTRKSQVGSIESWYLWNARKRRRQLVRLAHWRLAGAVAADQRDRGTTIGFGADVRGPEDRKTGEILKDVEPEDLLKFGLIPEFVGRLPVVATLDDLDKKSLIEILTKPKNALVKQYQRLFEMEDVTLTFAEDAFKMIAEKAIGRKTGARGLRSIMEAILLEPMFELPGLDGVEEIVINREVVEGRAQPLYIYTDRREDLETSA